MLEVPASARQTVKALAVEFRAGGCAWSITVWLGDQDGTRVAQDAKQMLVVRRLVPLRRKAHVVGDIATCSWKIDVNAT